MVVTHLVTRTTFSQNKIKYFSLLRFSLIKDFGPAPAAILAGCLGIQWLLTLALRLQFPLAR